MKAPPPIKVYEHQVLKPKEGSAFTNDHLKTLQHYYGDGQSCPYFSLIHNGVQFNQFVGVLQVGKLTIEVLPKTDKGEDNPDLWQGFLIDMLRNAGLVDKSITGESALKLKYNSILDLYIELFVKEVRYLLQTGLVKKYRKTEANSFSMRGSLQFSKNIQQNLTHAERFYVRYSNYDRNNLFNRILYKTLRFISSINHFARLQSDIESLLLDFPEVTDLKVSNSLFDRLVYDRKTESYRRAISIARLLLLMYHPDIKSGNNQVLALMFDMNLLWEKYVYRQLQKKLSGEYIVRDQVSTNFWKPEKGRMMQLKPDIVVYDKQHKQVTVLDTKWKNPGGNKPSPEDLRQMLAYNYYQNCRHSSLLYPYSGDKPFSRQGHYQKDEKECSLIFLPLQRVNQRMQLDLDAIELFIEICAKERKNEELLLHHTSQQKHLR